MYIYVYYIYVYMCKNIYICIYIYIYIYYVGFGERFGGIRRHLTEVSARLGRERQTTRGLERNGHE